VVWSGPHLYAGLLGLRTVDAWAQCVGASRGCKEENVARLFLTVSLMTAVNYGGLYRVSQRYTYQPPGY